MAPGSGLGRGTMVPALRLGLSQGTKPWGSQEGFLEEVTFDLRSEGLVRARGKGEREQVRLAGGPGPPGHWEQSQVFGAKEVFRQSWDRVWNRGPDTRPRGCCHLTCVPPALGMPEAGHGHSG